MQETVIRFFTFCVFIIYKKYFIRIENFIYLFIISVYFV